MINITSIPLGGLALAIAAPAHGPEDFPRQAFENSRFFGRLVSLESVDGREIATQKLEHTVPFVLPADKTFDVGLDARTPVDSSYELPFRFTGKINKLTFNLGPSQLAAADTKAAAEAVARSKD